MTVQPKMMAYELLTDNSFYVRTADGHVIKFTTAVLAIGTVEGPEGTQFAYKTEVLSYAMTADDFERIKPHLKPWQLLDKKLT